MQANLAKWGNSQAIRLPKALLERANISDSDRLNLTAENNVITITKAQKKRAHIPLAERLKDWNGHPYELMPEDSNWLDMAPVGEEV